MHARYASIWNLKSHRMHQTSNNRYNLNGYGSLRGTPNACRLEAPKRHGKKQGFFIYCILLILLSVIINNKDLLKTCLIFNFYAHISCKSDWNNFLLLNTNAPLSNKSKIYPKQYVYIFAWKRYHGTAVRFLLKWFYQHIQNIYRI